MTVGAVRAWWLLGALVTAASCGSSTKPSASDSAGAAGDAVGGSASLAGATGASGGSGAGTDGGGSTAGDGVSAGAGREAFGGGGTGATGGVGDAGGDGSSGDSNVDLFPYVGCVLSGSDPSNLAGEGGAGGSEAGGAANQPAAVAELDGDCGDDWGRLACSGSSVTTSLVCNLGKWELFATCPQGQTCDPSGGICADTVAACDSNGPGYAYCAGDELLRCMPDLRPLRADCCGVCREGSCQAPRCGDGRVTGYEACDDGNRLAGDGCEPDCKPSAVVELSGGGSHTCALLRGGAVRCWGDNRYGQLGLASSANVSSKHPYELATVELGARAKALALGGHHSCALLESGDVRCWGKNDRGQLGLGHIRNIGDDEAPSSKLGHVQLGAKVSSIAAGGDETCVVMNDGSARCWGANTYGQLGLGHTQDIGDDESPVAAEAEVSLGAKSLSVAVASAHACALLDNYLIRCWGHNDVGQLGLGHIENVGDDELPSDADVIDLIQLENTSMYSLSAGGRRACVGIHQGGQQGWKWCWGYNGDGGLGVGLIENRPYQKAGYWGLFYWGNPAEQVVVGATHQCVRLYNNALYCWGLNEKGQLGQPFLEPNGDDENVTIYPPVEFPKSEDGEAQAKTVTAGEFHTCALLDTGAVSCWGRNDRGQLGLGYVSSAPTDFVGGDAEHTPDKLPATRVLPNSK